MHLTSEQEQELLALYDDRLTAFATRFFYSYSGHHRVDLDDCIQECRIAFLKHIRRVGSPDEVMPLPYRDFKHAMCCLILSYLPASVPKRTAGFRRVMEDNDRSCSLDELAESGFEPACSSSSYDEIDERLSFEAFLEGLGDSDFDMVSHAMSSGSMTEAGRCIGVHKSTVCRRMAQLKDRYLSDCDIKRRDPA